MKNHLKRLGIISLITFMIFGMVITPDIGNLNQGQPLAITTINNNDTEESISDSPIESSSLALSLDNLETAEKTARWLYSQRTSTPYGITWPNELNNYTLTYENGVAGIGDFFLELYELTSNSTYLLWSNQIGSYLNHESIVKGDPGKYSTYSGEVAAKNYTGILSGSAGIGKFLARLYKNTNNQTYKDLAEDIAQELSSSAVISTGGTGLRIKTQDFESISGPTVLPVPSANLVDEIFDINFLPGSLNSGSWDDIDTWAGQAELLTDSAASITITHNVSATGSVQITRTSNESRSGEAFIQSFKSEQYPLFLDGIKLYLMTDRVHPTSYLSLSVYEANSLGHPTGSRIGGESQIWNSSFIPTMSTWINFNWSSNAPVLNGSSLNGYCFVVNYGDSGASNDYQSFFVNTTINSAYPNGKMALIRNTILENYRDTLFNITVQGSSTILQTRLGLNTTHFGLPIDYNTNNLINITVKAAIDSDSNLAVSTFQIFNWNSFRWESLSFFNTTRAIINTVYTQPSVRNYVGTGQRPIWLRIISGRSDAAVHVNLYQLNITLHYTDEVYSYSWGDGAAGVGDFFLDCYEIFRNPAYLNIASLLGNYLIEEKQSYPGAGGLELSQWDLFGQISLTYRDGNAGIGDFLLRLSQLNSSNSEYLSTAIEAARKIMASGTPTAGYNRFGDYMDTIIIKDQNLVDYPTGFLDGIAGMGAFLVNIAKFSPPASTPYNVFDSARQMANLMIAEKIGSQKYTTGPLINHLTSVEFSPLVQNGSFIQNVTYGNTESIPTLAEGLAGVMIFLSQYQTQTIDTSHADAIGAAIKYLVNNATEHIQSEGSYWNYNMSYRLDTAPASKYGLMHGMAGIGSSLVQTRIRARDGVSFAQNLAVKTEALTYLNGFYGLDFGLAGVGLGYLEQYHSTLNNTYYERAQTCADFLINPQNWQEATTYSMNSSGLAKGLAGFGLFELKMYQASGDEKYLDAAKMIGDTLVNRQVDGKWSYSLTTSINFTNYADGAAGIIDYLIELYKITQIPTYLNAINEGLDWLISRQQATGYWGPYDDQILEQNSYLGYYWGTAGIADVFVSAFQLTKSATYFATIVKAADYLSNIHTARGMFPQRNVINDPENVGYEYGVAGYMKFLLNAIQISNLTNREHYIANISDAAYRLVDIRAQVGQNSEQRYWSDYYSYTGEPSNTVALRYWNGMVGVLEILGEAQPLLKNVRGSEFAARTLSQIVRGKNYLEGISTSLYPIVGYFKGINGIAKVLSNIGDTDYPIVEYSNPSVNPTVEYYQTLEVEVEANDLGSSLGMVNLFYSINGTDFIKVPLTAQSPVSFSGQIPNLAWQTEVRYYISVHDQSMVSTPILAPGDEYFSYIVQDTVKPAYSNLQISLNYGINGGGIISLNITDDELGVGGSSGLITPITFLFESPSIPSGVQGGFLIKLPGASNTYYYIIPATYAPNNAFLRAGDEFSYTIMIQDNALNTQIISEKTVIGDTVAPILEQYLTIQKAFEISENEPVEIKVKVTDFEALGGSGLKRVYVKYSTDNTLNPKDWQEIDLKALGDNVFGGEIPGQARNQYIFYYICAEDNLGNQVAFSAKNAEGTIFIYSIDQVPEVLYYYHVVTNWTRILIIVGISVAVVVGIYLVWKYRGSYLDRMRREATSAATMITIKEKFLSIYYRIAEKLNEWGDKMSKKYYDATLKEKIADWLEDNKDSPMVKFVKAIGGGIKQISKYGLAVLLFPFLAFWALVTKGQGKRLILAALIGMVLIIASVIKFFGDEFYPMRAIFFIDFGFVLFIGAFAFIILHLIYEISAK